MEKFALLARLEAKPGKEQEVADFIKSALPLAQAEIGTVRWYALQIGPSTFGIFDTFADEAGRDVPVIVMGPPPDSAVLQRYAQAGVQRVLFWLPSARREGVERALDEVEAVMADLLGT